MINRRTFLAWSFAAPVALKASAARAQAVAQNTLVLIDGIGPDTDATRLDRAMQAFAQRGMPVSYILGPDAARLTPEHPVSRLLRQQVQQMPGLTDILPLVPDLATLTPYFQARALHDTQASYHRAIWGTETAPALRAVACLPDEGTRAPSGVRAGGIKTVMMIPSQSEPVRAEAWEDGVLRMIGGQRITLTTSPNTLVETQGQQQERLLYLSADDLAAFAEDLIAASAAQLADRLQQPTDSNWISPILAADMQFRDALGFRRSIALHFTLPSVADQPLREMVSGFRYALLDAGISSTDGPDLGAQSAYWIPVNDDLQNAEATVTAFSDVGRGTGPVAYGIRTAFAPLHAAGLNPDNILRLPTIALNERADIRRLELGLSGAQDMVITVPAELLRDRPVQAQLRQVLYALLDDGVSTSVTLPAMVRAIVPRGSYVTHYRRTEAYQMRAAADEAPAAPPNRAQLMEDARLAWSYFEKWTNRKTGLCPATVNFSSAGRRLHETVTMWDVGSQINALIAAVDLEIITAQQFQSAIKRILPNIAGRSSQNRLLPQGWIATDKHKWGNKNFDGCDAGRLMAALYRLETHPLAKDKPAATVGKWDLPDVIKDGVIYSVEEGEMVSTYRSHCAHYAAWAFRIWGLDVRSPYEVFAGRSDADGRMALLEAGGHIGPMGAEPLLLEALELGMSPESAYLADVLFAAQLEEYEQTGQLTGVSEGPIDRSPWFTYQGIQFDAEGRTWATDTVASLPEHRSKEFREKNLVVSAKAAFLWSAYRPHPYHDTLLAYVRDKARTDNGFASSIYRNTGEATRTYSDLNTNAIILQAIAHMLRDTPKQP